MVLWTAAMKVCFEHFHVGDNCPKCLKRQILDSVADLRTAMDTLKRINLTEPRK